MSVLKFIEQIARQWRQEQQQHQQQRRWRQQPPCRSNSGAADTGCREDDDASEASLVEKMAVFCVPFALKTINQRRCNGHFFGDFQEKNDFVFLINFCQRATLRNVRTNRQDFWKKKESLIYDFCWRCVQTNFSVRTKKLVYNRLERPGWK